MKTACTHTIHRHDHHNGWDNAFEPKLRVAPGETIAFETVDASGGQLSPDSTVADIAALDFGKVNPVTGPVYGRRGRAGRRAEDHAPGIRSVRLGLDRQHPGLRAPGGPVPRPGDPCLDIRHRDDGAGDVRSGRPGAAEAVRGHDRPGAGRAGVAQRGATAAGMGGNMDIRDMSAGTELLLPVEVAGALFSIGDTHACQGDGEVCGTAIESPMTVALKLDLVKGADIPFPQFRTPGPVSRHKDEKGFDVTTGVGPDLFEGARAARVGDDRPTDRRARDEAPSRPICCAASARISGVSEIARPAELDRLALFPALRPSTDGRRPVLAGPAPPPSLRHPGAVMASDTALLRSDGLTVGFNTDAGPITVVDGVDFTIAPGETLGLVGESGCGKSVTAMSIMRLLPSPHVAPARRARPVRGRGPGPLSEGAMRRVRGDRIGMIFQEPMTSLNPVWTVGFQLAEAVRLHRPVRQAGGARPRAGAAAAGRRQCRRSVGSTSIRTSCRAVCASGVMIAMAIASNPELLIADEPTTALDVTIQRRSWTS